jgi:16S rRNA (guanine966-N2)-methyltransferase
MKPHRPAEPRADAGRVRIIGGRLRGSKLDVPLVDGLRPTSDRVRETLFNWLAPVLHGARCIDVFAGSGALGFEAASRGAAEVVMLERDARAAAALRAAAQRLRADEVQVHAADALQWLAADPGGRAFDVAFVDPPFAAGVHAAACAALLPWLAHDAWLYVESAPDAPPPSAPWRLHRQGRTRDVRYALYRRADGSGAPATLSPDPEPRS